ncbi:TonB-dependent receptor [Granulicella sp. WH15]|uniref:TonB-dependent receptor n=1 Tax=Granulicella sp. WH15 TaxID=2602070 RepID=UPI0013A598ED|nr:TonB-dependent receptor [Granulicella sp. WH15]
MFLFSCVSLQAQNTNAGAIAGTVTDSTGAVVPGAQVTVTNQNTHQASTATSTGSGSYAVQNLSDGEYTVSVSKSGFQQTSVTDIHLDPGQRRGQDIKLSVGAVDSKITVQADTLAVQTESAESGGTISAKEVSNLMLNGRNFQQLATLVPGVSSVNGTNQQVNAGYLGQTDLIIGGASSEETTYTIDGVYNMTPTSLVNINITPSIDAINEMRILKNSYSAKYGFAGSGQVLIETKQGTHDFHGSGYEYIRNNSFAVARPYAISGVPATNSSLHLNIFGFSFGGPIYIPKVYNTGKNKTFFFTGAEFKTNHYASVLNSRSEFTPAIRGGDLSLSHDAPVCTLSGANSANAIASGCTSATLSDHFLFCGPQCQNLLAARHLTAANCITKDSFGVTNQVNPNCFDAASAYFINPSNTFMPLPNLSQNNNTSFANYINTNPELDSQNDTIYRIDHHIGDSHLITLRYMHEEVNNIRPARNYNDPAPNPGAGVYTPALNMLVRWNYNITPNIINTAGIAYTDQKVSLFPTGNYNIPGSLIQQAFNNGDTRLPAVSIGGFWSWLGVGVQPNFSKSGDGVFSDDLTLAKGPHVIQVGGLYMWNILRSNASAFSMGNFSFSGGAQTTGDTAADFLLGMASSYSQSNVQRAGVFHQHWFELYAQDDWKVTSRLTLNYGVRYSFYSPTTKEGNDITNFNAGAFVVSQAPAINPTSGQFIVNSSNQPLTPSGGIANYLTNGVVTACQNGTPCGFTTPKKNLFAPRVGFAYRVNSKGTMSIHGGYGLGYAQVGMFQTSNLLSNSPYVSTPTFSYAQFSSPAGGTASAPGLQSLSAIDSTYRPAMLQNWSFSVEDEIVPHGILNITYAGDKADHIFSNSVDRNFAINTTSANSAACAASGPTVVPSSKWLFDPCINTGTINTNFDRPYPGYSGITTGVSIGQSNYHGLQTGFVYRLADLQLNSAYTYSKALGNQNQSAQGNLAYGFDSNIGFQNPRNPAGDYGRPSYDRTHVFTSAYVYELPFFRHSSHLLAREILSGFGTSGLITVQSGFTTPVGLSSTTAGLANRPNQIAPLIRNGGSGKKALGQAPLYSYTSFALPAYGTFGNSEPGVLRGPKEVSFAAAVNKDFPVTDRVKVQIRAEAFNVFNHPNINSINSTFSSSTATNQSNFGYASTAGDMRQMEFSGRVTF